jgi:hypothetical protein
MTSKPISPVFGTAAALADGRITVSDGRPTHAPTIDRVYGDDTQRRLRTHKVLSEWWSRPGPLC